MVDVRVCLAGESFTTTKADFTFFPVTDAAFCFMYGPGLLEQGVPGRETTFVVQVDLCSQLSSNDKLDLATTKVLLFLVTLVFPTIFCPWLSIY